MMARQVYSKLKIAGVDLTLRSDDALSVTISKVPASSDLRRTVNGDLVNLSRSVFDKLAVSISGSGINTPPLSHLSIGGYTEVLLPDPVYLQSGGSSRATYPRALVDVEGFTISGQKIMPISQPPNRVGGMSVTFSSARVALLRTPLVIDFPIGVHAARGRPLLACRVVSWDIDNDDVSKEASWSLELEEV